MATDHVAQLALGAVLLAAGVTGVLGSAMHLASGGATTAVFLVLGAATSLAGVLLLSAAPGRRHPLALHLAAAGIVVVITAAIAVSRSPAGSVAAASLYLPVVVVVTCCFTPRSAVLHVAWTIALAWAGLSSVAGFGASQALLVLAAAALTVVTSRWLVIQADTSEVDPLTGLPNRLGLDRRVHEACAGPDAGAGRQLALVDLDGFSEVNAAGGRPAGDRLLRDVAARWAALVPAEAQLARVGADCFAVLLPAPPARAAPSAGTARSAAGSAGGSPAVELVAVLRAALPAGTTCSAGVAERSSGEGVAELFAHADAALLAVRGTGATEVHVDLAQGAAELLGAVARDEFEVHFQPVVEIATGLTRGVEALVRWRHPQRGLLGPGEFLPLAERSGAMVELGSWVLEEACRQATTWPLQVDGFPLRVAVNASGAELSDPGYAGRVERALFASGLPAEQLGVELVENAYNTTSTVLLDNLARLEELGVRTAIDDFGTGWSCLDRVARLGAVILKIDRTFVKDITGADEEHPVVDAIVALARAMSMDVVAEGVEDLEQLRWLERHGVGFAQGFLLDRPAPGTPRLDYAELVTGAPAPAPAPAAPHPAPAPAPEAPAGPPGELRAVPVGARPEGPGENPPDGAPGCR